MLKDKNPVARQGARDFEKRSISGAYVSIFGARARQHDGLRRSFPTACQVDNYAFV